MRWNVPAFTPETPSDHRRVRSSSAALRLNVVTRVRSALDGAVAYPAGHPQREDPGLSGPGPRHDAEQGLLRLDGLALGQGEAAGAGERLPGVVSKPSNVITTLRTVPKGCAEHPADLSLSWPTVARNAHCGAKIPATSLHLDLAHPAG